jgi:hypothetical protein
MIRKLALALPFLFALAAVPAAAQTLEEDSAAVRILNYETIIEEEDDFSSRAIEEWPELTVEQFFEQVALLESEDIPVLPITDLAVRMETPDKATVIIINGHDPLLLSRGTEFLQEAEFPYAIAIQPSELEDKAQVKKLAERNNVSLVLKTDEALINKDVTRATLNRETSLFREMFGNVPHYLLLKVEPPEEVVDALPDAYALDHVLLPRNMAASLLDNTRVLPFIKIFSGYNTEAAFRNMLNILPFPADNITKQYLNEDETRLSYGFTVPDALASSLDRLYCSGFGEPEMEREVINTRVELRLTMTPSAVGKDAGCLLPQLDENGQMTKRYRAINFKAPHS